MSTITNNFTIKSFIKATVPNYCIPFVMSFLSGYFRNDKKLMLSSYSSIALPSLAAAIVTYFILWYMERLGKFPENKYIRVVTLVVIVLVLFTGFIFIFNLQQYTSDIYLSSFIGTVITTFTQPISSSNKKSKNE